MSNQYICELCKKIFIQKVDYTRHKNKKSPCITMNELEQLVQTNIGNNDHKNNLTRTFKACLDIMRDNEGLTGEKALRNMSYLLILKQLEPHFGGEIDIDNYPYDFSHMEDEFVENHKKKLLEIVRFSNLAVENEDNVPNNMGWLWDDILSVHPSTKNIFVKGKNFDIQHKNTYKKLIGKLHELDLSGTEYDVLGNAYEEVIQDIMTGKVLGQFFTQPLVKKMMVRLINPQIYPDGSIDTCGDPTMGTGGFLITYLQHILEQAKVKNIEPNWEFIKTQGLYGKEIEPDTYQMAVSNMLISSGHMFEQLERGDSIRNPITRKFDNILANPPFGIKGLNYDDFDSPLKTEYMPIKANSAVSLFIQCIIHMLNMNGKCAVVLPDGQDLFSKTNKTLVNVRQYLMKTCDLKEISYLPSGIFTHTSIKTCVFYFVKKREGADVLETKVKYSNTTQKETKREYKFTKTHQTTKVKFYDYNPYEDVKNLLVEVPIEKISGNNYSLNYSEYMEEDVDDEEECGEGVIMKRLGDVCHFNIGGTPSRNKSEYYNNGNNLWVSVRELNGGYIYDTKEKITDLGVSKSSVKLFKKDTVLFSFKLSIGKTAIVGEPLYTNEAIAGINSKDNTILNNKYLYYYLSINDFTNLGSGIIGNGSLNKKSLCNIKIPITSLERQEDIVKYLDFIYEIANKTSSEKINELNRLKEFSLNNQKIFGNNEIMKLGNVCSFLPKSKRSAKYGNKEGLYPFYTSSQICSKYCDSYDYCDECLIIGSGGNANIKYNKEFSCSADNFIVKLNNGIITKYVYYYLLDNINILQKGFIGSGLKHISKEYIKNIKIPIPSLERQEEIVKYCESNDNLIRELEKDIEENKKQAQLFMSNVIKSNVLTGDNDINDSDNDIDNEDNGNEDDEEQNNNEETPSDCDNTDNTSDISDGSDIEETT